MRTSRCSLAVLCLGLLSTIAYGDTPSPTLTVRGVGTGIDQAAAVKDALGDAVLQVAAVVLDAPVFKKHRETITQKVLPKSADMVKSHEVLKSEKGADGKVSVRIRATVDRAAVIAELTEAGVPVAGASKSDAAAAELGEKVVKFCKDNLGQTVGDGECGTLAAKALEDAGGTPFHRYKAQRAPGPSVWAVR